MVDWLVVWGVTQVVGFPFKPILEDLAKDSAKDFVEDFFQDSLKSVFHFPSKEPLKIAAGKALKEFLQLVQQELEAADVDEQALKQYTKPLKQFIKDTSVAEILGSAFKEDCRHLDTRTLSQTWNDLNLLALPDQFDWERVAKRYLKKVKAIGDIAEYFCAWEFVERFGKRGAEGGLSLEQLKAEVFGAHWRDESWHEVLRLIAGMVDAQFAGEIIEYLMREAGEGDKFMNLFLAAGCLAEVRNRSQIATATQLLDKLKGLTEYDLHYYYDYSDREETELVREIRTRAVAAIATAWQDDGQILPWLKERAGTDDDWDVRQAAVRELARGWKDDPDTLPWLKERAGTDDHSDVRYAAVQELARGWKDDP
jgi:predicted NACHT family NTPase